MNPDYQEEFFMTSLPSILHSLITTNSSIACVDPAAILEGRMEQAVRRGEE